jgi:hypothetical protein
MTPSPQEVTPLLIDCRNGNKTALDRMMPLVSDVGLSEITIKREWQKASLAVSRVE